MQETRESDIRYIRAKLPFMTNEELSWLSAFVRGLGVTGFSYQEYDRLVLSQEQQRQADRAINTQ